MTALRDLPPMAVATQKQGRATLVVRRVADTIHVTATCDSLERLVHYYAKRSAVLQRQVEDQRQERRTHEHKATKMPLWHSLLYGLIALLAFYIIYNVTKRK